MHLSNIIALAISCVMAVNAEKIYHCTEPNTIALTFDDGPYIYTTDLLDQLKEAGIHATFFINGYNWWHDLETDPEKQAILTRAHNEGHQIASHTWRHAIPEIKEEIKPNLSRLDDLIEKCTGYRPKYFRAPKGDCKEDCIAYLEELGYHVIQWDTDTNDWDKDIGIEKRVSMVKEFLTNEFDQKRENYLVLMHDVHEHTVKQIVPWVIKNAPLDKYKFVTVAECLGDYKEGHFDRDGNPLPDIGDKMGFLNVNNTENIAPIENKTETVVIGTEKSNLQSAEVPQEKQESSGVSKITSNIFMIFALLAYSLYQFI
ncbi:glycoside hydrolase/deacetylase [Anaeromyces robustus]|jgi:peptidoglycan/xylan/chitin deacetylase (PgdA/CDA1 family)|uniref:Glycoside hydrolase/deacetylase n=1 Tax=Anaeromyces robustus TaxID=1754192 RepID=A0A1Y1WYG3_9FUNG|nr:glycoside hydrolase/deacetylase [Anaeromyces robustus]|eukprot:ORX78617.1 glycoside hydrolase/deacetylase [Anaeromyces robustus]